MTLRDHNTCMPFTALCAHQKDPFPMQTRLRVAKVAGNICCGASYFDDFAASSLCVWEFQSQIHDIWMALSIQCCSLVAFNKGLLVCTFLQQE